MISLTQIQRMIDHGSHAQLINRILSNGRCTCPAIREHLLSSTNSPDTPIAACGLALQRCCELSYLPTEIALHLADRLAAIQMPDGRFGIADDTVLASTAIAVRGLIDYREHLDDTGQTSPALDCASRDLDAHIDRGLSALARMVNIDTADSNHAIGIAIAVWQLGHLPAFRERVDVDRILALLCQQEARVLDRILISYAFAQAA